MNITTTISTCAGSTENHFKIPCNQHTYTFHNPNNKKRCFTNQIQREIKIKKYCLVSIRKYSLTQNHTKVVTKPVYFVLINPTTF